MGILEIILIGLSVAMDAFAVSICKGMASNKKTKTALICGCWFAIFQMLMPAIGYFVGYSFSSYIESFDHWIVFVLLLLLGSNMIRACTSTPFGASQSPRNHVCRSLSGHGCRISSSQCCSMKCSHCFIWL